MRRAGANRNLNAAAFFRRCRALARVPALQEFPMAVDLAEEDAVRGMSLHKFTASALFERTFEEGMSLVEECARYLDGRGRDEARALSRKAALVYAGESMRVT